MVRHVASWTFQNGGKQSPLNALDMMNAMAFDGVELEPTKRQPLISISTVCNRHPNNPIRNRLHGRRNKDL